MTTGQWYQCPSVAERASAEGYATSCVAFDPYYELLWTGGQNGSLTSYVVDVYDEAVLQRYTTAWAHQADIRQLLPIENGIVSLAADELRYTKRGGVRISSFRCVAHGPE
jgi:PAB-dependent poly(A)-specific ribonuclease subunit 2